MKAGSAGVRSTSRARFARSIAPYPPFSDRRRKGRNLATGERQPKPCWRQSIRLARRYADKDRDAEDFLNRLEVEDLEGLISEPGVRSGSPLDAVNQERGVKKDELYQMGLHLARAVTEGAVAVNGEIPEGKKIIGIAKHMLEIKKAAGSLTLYQREPQDGMSRSVGTNLLVDDDDLVAVGAGKKPEGEKPKKTHKAHGAM